jgi:peptidoglycan L-alanyl-D-glutamate endopeptidase CwlK
MPSFSQTSELRLGTCDQRLQDIFNEVIKRIDCTILCGHRPKPEQDAAVAAGTSKLPYPQSAHNKWPSRAVDAIPHPLKSWTDVAAFDALADVVVQVAAEKGVKIRCGRDFKTLVDRPHFELVD